MEAGSQYELSQNSVDCINKVYELWTRENYFEMVGAPDFQWGLTHGDFHPG